MAKNKAKMDRIRCFAGTDLGFRIHLDRSGVVLFGKTIEDTHGKKSLRCSRRSAAKLIWSIRKSLRSRA